MWWDESTLYVYHNGVWTLSLVVVLVPLFAVGNTAPVGPAGGDMWWDTETGRLYIYYIDIDSSQWIDTSPPSLVRMVRTYSLVRVLRPTP